MSRAVRDSTSAAVIPWRGIERRGQTMTAMRFSVPGMSCGHCKQAVSQELLAIDGVDSVEVDLDTKIVVVRGANLTARACAPPLRMRATNSPRRTK